MAAAGLPLRCVIGNILDRAARKRQAPAEVILVPSGGSFNRNSADEDIIEQDEPTGLQVQLALLLEETSTNNGAVGLKQRSHSSTHALLEDPDLLEGLGLLQLLANVQGDVANLAHSTQNVVVVLVVIMGVLKEILQRLEVEQNLAKWHQQERKNGLPLAANVGLARLQERSKSQLAARTLAHGRHRDIKILNILGIQLEVWGHLEEDEADNLLIGPLRMPHFQVIVQLGIQTEDDLDGREDGSNLVLG
mmetsp:Transcript_6358/g.14664  ORF Transcript_6358/g.14664 Transcript_6358/m.14664 type:complete len:249 (-) Transcript_6358:184-930(-)